MKNILLLVILALSVAARAEDKYYAVQVGSFKTGEEAAKIRNSSPKYKKARIEIFKDPTLGQRYRLLLGKFKTKAEAQEYIVNNSLGYAVPDVWVNPDKNPEWKPSEKPKPQNPEMEGPHYFHFGFAPLAGIATVGADTASNSYSLTESTAGIYIHGSKELGGWSPTFDYKLLFLGHLGDGKIFGAPFTPKHLLNVGVQIPFFWHITFHPKFGFGTSLFLYEVDSKGHPKYYSYWLPNVSLKISKGILQFEKQTEIEVGFGFTHTFAATKATRNIRSGNEWSVELKTKSHLSKHTHGEWFLEYTNLRHDTSDIQQTENVFLFGFSIGWSF